MGDIPTPRSYPQILGDQIDRFRSKQGIKNLKVGSGVLSTLEAAAQSDLRSSQDTFGLLNAINLDDAEGLALERWGADEQVPKIRQSAATGAVDISDVSFTKKSSKLFQGAAAPIVGSVVISVVNVSDWPSSGQVYLGRGTSNYEGPLTYTSKTDAGTHWTLNLSSGTTKFHNTFENAILAQGGNRVIGSNTIVRTPQANVADAVEFRTLYARTIADGETIVQNVPVVAQQLGIIGNVGRGQIKEFSSSPFEGATVTNTSPFSNGTETESDDDYRERIKAAKRSRALGTPLAITTSVTGITAPDENKRISSATLVKRTGLASTLYIDDGTGYEERIAGVAVESLVDSAIGGEQSLEANQHPIAQASAITTNSAPFALSVGAILTVKVGGVAYVHPFETSDFLSLENATADEVCASINSDPTLAYVARTADTSTRVSLCAKSDTNHDIEVVASDGVDANDALAFPPGINTTMQLYKNDRLLTKDGSSAIFTAQSFSVWDTFSGSQTLIVAVDGTPAVTYTFTDQDFVDAKTAFTTIGRNSIAAWIAVFNAKIPGITASEAAGRMVLTSNAGAASRASIVISGGTLVSGQMFAQGTASGATRDYMVNRNESQIGLEVPLVAGDRLSIGTKALKAFVESGDIGTITLSADAKLWFVVDGSAELVPHGVTGATLFTVAVSALHEWGHMLTLTAGSGTPFTNVSAGDWLILWDPALDSSLHGSFRVASATSTAVTIERRLARTLHGCHRSVALATVSPAPSKILTTGGTPFTRSAFNTPPVGAVNLCEIYDPATHTSVAAAPMNTARSLHTATLLPNGKVLVTGGLDVAGNPLASIELYNPTTDTWTTSAAVLATPVAGHTATLLNTGNVLIVGGGNGNGNTGDGTAVTTAKLYLPGSDSISATGAMGTARQFHRALLLPSGNVLIAGGQNTGAPLASTEIYSAGGGTFSASNPMTTGRKNFGLSLIGTVPTTVLAVGAGFGDTGTDTYQVYTIAGGSWGSETTIPNNFKFEDKESFTRTNGNVLMLHGTNTSTSTSAAATFDGTTWRAKNSDPLSTDSIVKFGCQVVPVTSSVTSNWSVSVGGYIKGKAPWAFIPTAHIQEITGGTTGTGPGSALVWLIPDPGKASSLALTDVGISVVRTTNPVYEADIDAGTNYTATSIVSALASSLPGAAPSVYRTNRLRVTTNTATLGGDIALVAQDENSAGLKLTTGGAVENLTSHVGAVETANSEIGTPSFDLLRLRGVGQAIDSNKDPLTINRPTGGVNPGYGLIGLADLWSGVDGSSAYAPTPASFYKRAGSNNGYRSRILSSVDGTYSSVVTPRSDAARPWSALDRVFLAAPYALGPSDEMTVVVDNDITKRFTIKTYRRLQSVGSTYSNTNVFRDADSSGASLAATFGLDYDFNDFAVYMASRAIAFSATANKRTLIRYSRLGPEGDGVQVRFSNPNAPLATVACGLTYNELDATTELRIRLAGGAARTPTLHSVTKVGGVVASVTGTNVGVLTHVLNLAAAGASRTTNVTTLTLTLPPGVTDHGFQVSDAVWVQSTDSNFSSGLKTITARAAGTISYAEVAANASGSNIGTVSFDSLGEATFAGSGVAVGDFFRVNAESWFNDGFVNNTFYVTAIANGYIQSYSGEVSSADLSAVDGQLQWSTIGQTANFLLFANPAQAMNTVIAALNALAAVDNSTVPITLKALGAGTGTIDRSTTEDQLDEGAWFTLADGINWVAETTSPGSVSGDYTLTFKKDITGILATVSDWANEEVRIAPTSTANVVQWLSTPTVSGLFTVCSIQASDDGSKIQIASKTSGSAGGVQVQGGNATSVTSAVVGAAKALGSSEEHAASTIRKADATGLTGGMWCKITNTSSTPKSGVFVSGSSLTSWATTGIMHLSSVNIYSTNVAPFQSKVLIERQGRFVAITDVGLAGFASLGSAVPGSFVRITAAGSPTSGMPQVSSANQGIFRVVRSVNGTEFAGTIWIENDNAIEECSECTLASYTPDSIMPGDELIISTPIFGSANQGRWIVEQVGSSSGLATGQFTNGNYLKVSVVDRTPVVQGPSSTLGASSPLVQIVEGTPATFVMRIDGIAPNQDDGSYVDIKWDKQLYGSTISESTGSVLAAMDKLDFPIDFTSGSDGYAYNTGLLGEVNRVVYGDPADTTTYPGVAAAGAVINGRGPLTKRIRISLSLTVRSGIPTSDIADRVRSAVATVVNKTPGGQSVSISAIIAAVQQVKGVLTVAVVSPTYNAANPYIPVQLFEKPKVLNLDQDIQVTFTDT